MHWTISLRKKGSKEQLIKLNRFGQKFKLASKLSIKLPATCLERTTLNNDEMLKLLNS